MNLMSPEERKANLKRLGFLSKRGNYLIRSLRSVALRLVAEEIAAGRCRVNGHGFPAVKDGTVTVEWEVRQLMDRGLCGRDLCGVFYLTIDGYLALDGATIYFS